MKVAEMMRRRVVASPKISIGLEASADINQALQRLVSAGVSDVPVPVFSGGRVVGMTALADLSACVRSERVNRWLE